MEDIFITEFLNLDNEFKELGVFDSIINRDSPFFINLLRLKVNKTPEFQGSYERINSFYRKIMILLDSLESLYQYHSKIPLLESHAKPLLVNKEVHIFYMD